MPFGSRWGNIFNAPADYPIHYAFTGFPSDNDSKGFPAYSRFLIYSCVTLSPKHRAITPCLPYNSCVCISYRLTANRTLLFTDKCMFMLAYANLCGKCKIDYSL